MSSIRRLLESPWRGVIFATGGSQIISDIATQPGASNTLLEATVPYNQDAVNTLLGFQPAQSCSALTARSLALSAFSRAQKLASIDLTPEELPTHIFGLGITAALRSAKPKRGEHRAYIAVQTPQRTVVWHLPFEKGALRREEEERQLADTALRMLDEALGLHSSNDSVTPIGDGKSDINLSGLFGDTPHKHGHYDKAVLPGSFNPIHEAHTGMRRTAEGILKTNVSYELSVQNVDKPMLDYIDLDERIAGFNQAPYVLTNQPTFVAKAELLFPHDGGTFVVGADTIQRIDQRRYYNDSMRRRNLAIARLAELSISFLVFGRVDENHTFQSLSMLEMGSDLRTLCVDIPEDTFRLDISSTAIRQTVKG